MRYFIEIIKAVVLGIVQGVTEWLPISSTGHMILIDEFMRMNVSQSFKEMFFVIIQLGSIMAVVFLFFNKLNPLLKPKGTKERREIYDIWFKVAVACVPAIITGVLFDDLIDKFFYNYNTVATMLIFYGIVFIIIENWNKNKQSRIKTLEQLNYKIVLWIGMFQVLAFIPGTSRSGATIIGAILFGTSRYIAAEFTFFLAIPIMFGASFLKLFKFGFNFSSLELGILFTGCIVAFLVSMFVIRFFMEFLKKHDFKVFGYYRIILGILILLYFSVCK